MNPVTRPKVYIASSLYNWRQVQECRDQLAEHGVDLTYDWSVHGAAIEADPQYAQSPNLEDLALTAQREIDGVLQADALLFLWPGRNGAHFELGLAYARKTPIVFHLPDPAAHTWTSFHARPELHRVGTVQDAITTVLEIVRGNQGVTPHLMDLYDEPVK